MLSGCKLFFVNLNHFYVLDCVPQDASYPDNLSPEEETSPKTGIFNSPYKQKS